MAVNDGNHGFEEQLRKLVSEAKDELHAIDSNLKAVEKRRLELVKELQSYETSLRGYLQRAGCEPEGGGEDWDALLKDCRTHRERVLTIARHDNGEIRMSPTIDILYNGKQLKSKSRTNAYLTIYHLLGLMTERGELEKVGKARFRLAERDTSL